MVDDFYVIWKSICHFLSVIDSNLGLISHRFWDMASFPLTMHIFLPFYSTHILEMFSVYKVAEILHD